MLWSRENLSQCLLAEDMAQFVLTLGSVYALKAEDGFTLIRFPSMVISILSNSVLTGRLRSKAGEVVRGEVLKKAVETEKRKDSIQYVGGGILW